MGLHRFAVAVLAALALLPVTVPACSKVEPPPTKPTCKGGFRNQCIDDVALGSQFGCSLLADRTVWCWGRNDRGQLGYNTTDLCPEDIGGGETRSVACHTFPFQVPGLTDPTAIASGAAFSCALVEGGGVRCWGGNTMGELGNGKTVTSQTPVAVGDLANVSSIALGGNHACALREKQVLCWGSNERGQLGVPSTSTCKAESGTDMPCATTPVAVPWLADVIAISAGAQHTCALTSDGKATCWGDNRWGQLGIGVAREPAPIDPPTDDAGAIDGASDGGLGGGGDTKPDTLPKLGAPVMVTLSEPLGYLVSISAGAHHTCALREGGDVYCWGRDDHHELGGPPPPSGAALCDGPCFALAVKVADLPPTTEPPPDAGIEPPEDTAVEVPDTRSDAAMDARDSGPVIPDTYMPPLPPPTGGTFGRALSSGNAFSCVRLGDGTVRCWGSDTVGQLGDGRTTNDPSRPSLVIASPGAARDNPLQDVVKVRAGATSACAIVSDHSLRCWGSNQNGALGVGHFTPQQGPVPVSW